jgi:hypothetical protein
MTFVTTLSFWWDFHWQSRGGIRIPGDLVDSASGQQETLKPPSGGFFIYGSVIN